MTNNEILKADILDILFENRNKEYGAYALRKTYDKRLLIALCGGLAIVAMVAATGFLKSTEKSVTIPVRKDSVIIKEYVVPQNKIQEPVQAKQEVKQKASVVKTTKVKLTSKIDIKRDELVKTTMTDVTNLADKLIDDHDITGKPDDGTVKIPETPTAGKDVGGAERNETPATFVAQERNAEFPGGADALRKYLADNLRTPEDLADGEKKEVKIRFSVDADGGVSGFEIVASGGAAFDKEVLRVCRKMPRWTPALQNGINVPVNYMIPVTFIGADL